MLDTPTQLTLQTDPCNDVGRHEPGLQRYSRPLWCVCFQREVTVLLICLPRSQVVCRCRQGDVDWAHPCIQLRRSRRRLMHGMLHAKVAKQYEPLEMKALHAFLRTMLNAGEDDLAPELRQCVIGLARAGRI